MSMVSIGLFDNIPNDVNELTNAISSITGDEILTYNELIRIVNDKIKTMPNNTDYLKKLTQIFTEYSNKISQIRSNMDKIYKDIQMKQNLKDKIRLYINGTFKCIDIDMKDPNFNINMPIDTFSDDKLTKLAELGFITKEIYQEELEWRKIIKEYPTIDSKNAYILELDYTISVAKQELDNNIDTIRRINIIKAKINQIKYIIVDNNIFHKIFEKYNIDTNMSLVPNVSTISDVEMQTEEQFSEQASRELTSPPPVEFFTNESEKKPVEEKVDDLTSDIAPVNIYLERICKFGDNCSHKKNPLRCGYNHISIGNCTNSPYVNKINKGDVIPSELCKNEKPWDNIRCTDLKCFNVHCVGRVVYIINENKKNSQIESIERGRSHQREHNRIRSPSWSPPPHNRSRSPNRVRSYSFSPRPDNIRPDNIRPHPRSRSRSPLRRSRSRSPLRRPRSPLRRPRSPSPLRRHRSPSPLRRPRSPLRRPRSPSPFRRPRSPPSRPRSPSPARSFLRYSPPNFPSQSNNRIINRPHTPPLPNLSEIQTNVNSNSDNSRTITYESRKRKCEESTDDVLSSSFDLRNFIKKKRN